MTNDLKWSCEEKNRRACRNPHGCHCREISDLLEQVRMLERRRDAEAPDWEGAFRNAVR